MRIIRIIGIVAGVLLMAAAIAAVIVATEGGRAVAWLIEHPISDYIGRKITVAGPITVDWGAPTRLSLGDVRIANAPWGTSPDMLTVDRIDLKFYPLSLLRGPERFPLISIDRARLLLETAKNGERNWSFLDKLLKPGTRRQLPVLNKVVVSDSDLVFHNGTTGATNTLTAARAELDAPDRAGPAKFAFAGSLQDEPLRLAGTVGPLAELRQLTKPYPVDLDGSFGDSRLVLQGTMRKPLIFSGLDLRISLDGKGLQRLAAALDLPLPPLPDFRATGVLAGGKGDWTLKALSAKLGASDIEGGIAIDVTGKVPYLRANLTSSYVDLADFTGFLGTQPAHSSMPAPAPAKPADNSGRIISATSLATNRLLDINADLGFEAGRVKGSKGLPLERVSAALHLANGVLTLKPLDFAMADGTVDFGLRLDARPDPPRLKLDLDIRHIDLHDLVAGMTRSLILKETGGIAGGFVHFVSTGRSLRVFLGRMDRRAALFAQDGRLSDLLQRLVSLDVLRALGLLVAGDQPTPVNCLVSDFALGKGVATARTAVLDTSTTLVTGSGNFNFAAETIFLDFRPYNKDPALFTLRTPVYVRGTFGSPSIGISPTGIAEKVAAGAVLGTLLPPLGELLPFINLGLGSDNACSRAFSLVRSSSR